MAVSLRKAINDKCKDCGYDALNGGTWRQQIEACTCKKCPLWEVRPVSAPADRPKGEIPEGLKNYIARLQQPKGN